MRTRVRLFRTRVRLLRTQVRLFRTRVRLLRTRIQLLRTQVQLLRTRVQLLRTRVQLLRTRVQLFCTRVRLFRGRHGSDLFGESLLVYRHRMALCMKGSRSSRSSSCRLPMVIYCQLPIHVCEGQIRSIALDNVLIDTGATTLCRLPQAIAQLGLDLLKEVDVITAAGLKKARIFQDTLR